MVTTGFSPQTHGFRFANRFTQSFEYEFPLIGQVDLGTLVVGLCGGMCFAGLDYFHARKVIPAQSRVPPSGSRLRHYLERRQFDSLVPPRGILKVLTWMVRSDRSIAGLTARSEFRMLRNRLDRGQPAVLALIRADDKPNPTKNHQVVARSYNFDRVTKQLKIDLYDPNHPRRSPNLTFDLARPSRGIASRQSTGEPLRGFFVIDYKRSPPPRDL